MRERERKGAKGGGWIDRQTNRQAMKLSAKHTKEAYWKLQVQVLGENPETWWELCEGLKAEQWPCGLKSNAHRKAFD